jgi:hypothetical protein
MDPVVLSSIVEEATPEVLSRLTAQGLTRLAWAMASTCKLEDSRVVAPDVDAHIPSPLVVVQSPKAGLSSPEPSPFTWFSDAKVQACLGNLSAAALARGGEFTPDLLALLVWSCVTMGHFPVELLSAAFPRVDDVGAWDRIPVPVGACWADDGCTQA